MLLLFLLAAQDLPPMRAELTFDGVHPHAAGYAAMAPLARAAIGRAMAQR